MLLDPNLIQTILFQLTVCTSQADPHSPPQARMVGAQIFLPKPVADWHPLSKLVYNLTLVV